VGAQSARSAGTPSPQVWELIRKGICSKVEASGAVKKTVFNSALKMKQFATDYSVPGLAGLTDRVVFNQVKAQTGGRLKIALSGGGAVSATTQEFLCNAVVKVIQGGFVARFWGEASCPSLLLTSHDRAQQATVSPRLSGCAPFSIPTSSHTA
jgi:hypothetical protein